MFDTPTTFMNSSQWRSETWLSNAIAPAPARISNVMITPREPTTLSLALIGIGTIAVYWAATWRRRAIDKATGQSRSRSVGGRSYDRAGERPTRGAA